ncbi:hypothetical protein R3P38DRAFT_3254016 [Favolaschia claudopus]|uniref:Uncharacterized protein n=1 Tax=Favolaschia claudopus TaxID=2862362 RepID=A0AAW0DYU3_9AGAR
MSRSKFLTCCRRLPPQRALRSLRAPARPTCPNLYQHPRIRCPLPPHEYHGSNSLLFLVPLVPLPPPSVPAPRPILGPQKAVRSTITSDNGAFTWSAVLATSACFAISLDQSRSPSPSIPPMPPSSRSTKIREAHHHLPESRTSPLRCLYGLRTPPRVAPPSLPSTDGAAYLAPLRRPSTANRCAPPHLAARVSPRCRQFCALRLPLCAANIKNSPTAFLCAAPLPHGPRPLPHASWARTIDSTRPHWSFCPALCSPRNDMRIIDASWTTTPSTSIFLSILRILLACN